jgi:nitroimidazol reductase NimA-like FMN-containing flavoprotein (pyridoxamine 5'-phosphate oxidase superfamily)
MADQVRAQRRGRRIAMTAAEVDDFLSSERTCRVATTGPDGPHATPLWFGWQRGRLWLYSITRSQRWADLQKDPRVGVVVDAGHDYDELRGVEILGTVAVVGETPRIGEAVAELDAVESAFAQKYFGLDQMFYDQRHAWLAVTPTKINSWDFRKLATTT